MSGDHEVNQVFFTDAVTSVDNRIGAEGAGWTIAKFLLENERADRVMRRVYSRASTDFKSWPMNNQVELWVWWRMTLVSETN